MIRTVYEMAETRDGGALTDMWRLLGGEVLALESDDDWDSAALLVAHLIQQTCGGPRDPYLAERKAFVELAKHLKVPAENYPTTEGLEDAVIEAAATRIQEKLASMTPEKRRELFEELVRRLPDEERIRLIDQVLAGYENMDPIEQQAFVRQLAADLGVTEDKLRAALAGGAAALLPLILADQAGFAVFLLTTEIMYSAFSAFGVTLPFAAYVLKNEALGFLLGPVGMVLTAAVSAGWFAYAKVRRERRFRKLIQLAARASSWRDAPASG